ncbi:ankyrin repeat-containing domain protein [Amanita rubescens]|nr:ankyrin repeat-containing domain protein [Amanita rubescens]
MCIKSFHFDSFPLQKYCSAYWPSHIVAGDLGHDDEITEMLKPLFEPENNGKQLTSYEFLDDEDYSTHIREPESPLVYAALLGAVKIVKWLLETDWEANVVDLDLNKALLAASHIGYIDIVILLLDHGADAHATHKQDNTSAFQYGVYKKHLNILQLLLKRGVDVNQKGWKGVVGGSRLGNALHAAICGNHNHLQNAVSKGNVEMVKLLCSKSCGASEFLDEEGTDGTALEMALSTRKFMVAGILLEAGAMFTDQAFSKGIHCATQHQSVLYLEQVMDWKLQYHPELDASNALNWALADASFNGNIELVRILLEKYNVDANGLEGIAVINASLNGHLEVLKVLEVAGGMSSGCEGALQAAAYMGRQDTLEHLLEHRSFDVNHCESNDHTALEDALIGGYPDIAKMLIEKGADVNGSEGMALEMAARRGYADVVKMMIERGAAMNGVKYALEQGVNEGWVDVVKVLLEGRKDLIGDEELRRALRVARQKGYTEVVEMLEREVDDAAKDEEPAQQLIKQGTMGAIRNADGDEGATETFANGGMALAGLGLLACTFALFYLRRRGTQSE